MLRRTIKNLSYWLSIDHLDRIRTFGIRSHLKYVFNFNVSRIVVNMQAELSNLTPLVFPQGYMIREMEIRNPNEIYEWIRIVNSSYQDADENETSFKQHIYSHPFLDVQKVFFVMSENQPVGAVSVGLYKKNPEYGGDARIAVVPSVQGNGLGYFAISYAFHYLRKQGIDIGEAVISLKRKQSIFLHLRCGFRPQYDRSKVILDTQKRMWPARLIAERRIKKLTKSYFMKEFID